MSAQWGIFRYDNMVKFTVKANWGNIADFLMILICSPNDDECHAPD